MNVTCDKCNKRYAIADDKVRGKSVKIRCKQCQNLISVQGPPAGASAAATLPITAQPAMGGGLGAIGGSPWEDERTRAMPAMDLSPTWFAMVKGKQIGPLTVRDLDLRVKTGEVSLRTYLWKQGMADWKRASDVPEVSPVFAGVSVGASAVGPVQAAPLAGRPISKSTKSVARDVATANEVPSPEITRKPNGNGHGTVDPVDRDARTQIGQPSFVPARPSRPKTGQFQKPQVTEPAPSRGAVASKPAGQRVESKPSSRAVERTSNIITDKEQAALSVPASSSQPLNDLFADVSGLHAKGDEPSTGERPISGLGGTEPVMGGAAEKGYDPFAALGDADPRDAPPPGEATKFFIAQAGVNKRNPPWKIALFVVAIIGLPVGILYMLSSLHVVPPVLVQNEQGEMVEQEFFSPKGFSTGLKDLLSGDAKKKKLEAAKAAAEREKAKRVAAAQQGNDNPDALPEARGKKPDAPPKYSEEELKKLYGSGGPTGSEVSLGPKTDTGPKIRFESERPTIEKGGGLDADVVAKTMNERMKALVGCVEDVLKRNPNVKLEKVTLVLQVGTSGAVKSASLEPKRVELTDWGACIMQRAKKISFPAADSESEIQIPLVLGASMQ